MPATCAARRDLLERLASEPSAWGREARVGVLAEIEGLRGWLDSREAAVLAVCHAKRDDVNSGARDITQLCQQRSNVSYGSAKLRAVRAEWLPVLGAASEALATGVLGSGQVDELCALAERLPAELRGALYGVEADLIAELAALTPVQARKRLAEWEADITPDDGTPRLERQQKQNRLRFAKNSDGTTSLFGRLDPLSAAYLRTCVDHKVTELWRSQGLGREQMDPPAEAMSNEQLRAKALVELVRQGHAAGPGAHGHAELLVMIDYKTLIGDLTTAGVCRLGDSTPLPGSIARRLACEAGIIPIVLGGPSQPLDVGRGARTATTAQKAAARAVHDTCCVSGCDVAFEYCEMHHVTWWRNGGDTNLNNLVPVCSKHHHLIHDNGWDLHLDPNRTGTLREHPNRRDQTDHGRYRPKPESRPQPGPRSQNAPTPMRC